MINLTKYLGQSKVISRRQAAEAVKNGRVKVEGQVILEPFFQVQDGAEVKLDGVTVGKITEFSYWILNKPASYVCTKKDDFAEKTVFELMENQKLSYAGRLDKESEGMLLLSDDGDWINRLSHPRFEVLKCYFVAASPEFSAAEIAAMRAGVSDEGEFLKPRIVAAASGGGCYFVLNEGKKREIRRIVRCCSISKITLLRRLSVGKLMMEKLLLGSSRKLTMAEIKLATAPDELPEKLAFLKNRF